MNDWTPGPWPVSQSGDGKRWIVGKGLVEGPNGYEVAEVYADDAPYSETRANAHLIAAAPCLLEALENIVIGIGMGWDLQGLMDVATAAVDKARSA